ncbi:MAG: hypothetical protein ACLT98_10080 [Eggerthellaceae bacterium]
MQMGAIAENAIEQRRRSGPERHFEELESFGGKIQKGYAEGKQGDSAKSLCGEHGYSDSGFCGMANRRWHLQESQHYGGRRKAGLRDMRAADRRRRGEEKHRFFSRNLMEETDEIGGNLVAASCILTPRRPRFLRRCGHRSTRGRMTLCWRPHHDGKADELGYF